MDYFDILLAKKLNGGGGGDITIEDLYVNENGTVIAPSGKAYGKVVTDVPAPFNALYKQTLSGLPAPIATFTGADAPLDSLKASIVGVQDLHGYDKPWPAGGGVNRLDPNSIIQGSTLIPSATNRCSNRGTKTILVSVGDTFTISRQSTDVRYTMAIRDVVTDEAYSDTGWETSDSFTFTVDYAGYMEIIFSYTNNANITPDEVKAAHFQIEKNSSATPFTPYSNICPISGWTKCEVTDNNDTYTILFKDSSDNPITVYGGGTDVTGGKLTVTHANIASYNGEAINEPWISSEDVYTQGATPTTGAQVVYPLTTPLVYEFNPLALRSDGVTNISVNCGEVTECKYFSDNP